MRTSHPPSDTQQSAAQHRVEIRFVPEMRDLLPSYGPSFEVLLMLVTETMEREWLNGKSVK
jgi:hypothetical protein